MQFFEWNTFKKSVKIELLDTLFYKILSMVKKHLPSYQQLIDLSDTVPSNLGINTTIYSNTLYSKKHPTSHIRESIDQKNILLNYN